MEMTKEIMWGICIVIIAVLAMIGWFIGGKYIPKHQIGLNNEVGAVVGGFLGAGIAYFSYQMML